ncbi:MAG: hypothetical protein IKE64_12925 [Thermoguttaceae bacterium]|nr:hypothetical protein [Thermoguttaceae bacterium]
MKRMLAGIFLFAVALTAKGLLAEEPMKPAAYVVVRNYNTVIKAASTLAKKTGNEDVFGLVGDLCQGLEGIDQLEPIIVGVLADTSRIVPFGFVPVADFSDFSLPKLGKITTRYNPASRQLTVKFKKKSYPFTVVSQDTSSILVPKGTEEPPQRIGMEDFTEEDQKESVFYGRVYPNRFPEEIRQSLLASLSAKLPDISRIIEPFLRQVDSVGLGLRVDHKSGDLVLSYDIRAVPESDLATVFSWMSDQKSRWNALLDHSDNVFSICFNAVFPESMTEQVREACQNKFRDIFQTDIAELEGEEAQKAHSVLDNFASFCDKTLARGEADIAITLTKEPFLIAAMTIEGGDDLLAALDGLGTVLKEIDEEDDPLLNSLPDIRFNLIRFNDYTITSYSDIRANWDLGKVNPDLSSKDPTEPGCGFLLGVKEDSLLLVAGPRMMKVPLKFKELAGQEYSPKPISPTMTRLSINNLGSLLTFLIPERDIVYNRVGGYQVGGYNDVFDYYSMASLMSQEKAETQITQTLTRGGPDSLGGELVVSGGNFSFFGKLGKQMKEKESKRMEEENAEFFEKAEPRTKEE